MYLSSEKQRQPEPVLTDVVRIEFRKEEIKWNEVLSGEANLNWKVVKGSTRVRKYGVHSFHASSVT